MTKSATQRIPKFRVGDKVRIDVRTGDFFSGFAGIVDSVSMPDEEGNCLRYYVCMLKPSHPEEPPNPGALPFREDELVKSD